MISCALPCPCACAPLQVVPSLGQMKVLHRRLASAAQPGGAQPFPQLAQGWAASHRGKAFIDQVGGCGGGALLRMELQSTLTGHSQLCCRCLYVFAIIAGA